MFHVKHSIKRPPIPSHWQRRNNHPTLRFTWNSQTFMKPVTLSQLGRKRNPTSIYIRICLLDSNMPHMHPHPWGLFSCWQPHRRQQGTNRKSMPYSLLFQTSRKWSHASMCWEAKSFFPATEASMFHVKHPPPTRKTKTQNTTPTHNKKQPTFHVKQLNCCRNIVFHVKHDNPLNKPIAPTTTQKSYGEAHPQKELPTILRFHVKQLGCCRDAVFHVKHSTKYPPNPQWHSTTFQPAYPW